MSNEQILNRLHLLLNNSFLKNESLLQNISSYNSCNFQTKLIKAFDLKLSESEIPVEKFKTISDIITFIILVQNRVSNTTNKDKQNNNLKVDNGLFSDSFIQTEKQLNEKILKWLQLLFGNSFINKNSQLRNISSYNSCNFQTKLIKAFDLKLSESEIPIEKFKTINDIITFITLVHNGEFNTTNNDNDANKVNSTRVNRSCPEENTRVNEQLNIIVTGKSGVGKSSFLNYLIGEDLFMTGVGEPVTQQYFENKEYISPNNGVKYNLIDTKGIEPTTTEEHREKLLENINANDSSDNVFQWIHVVYYCFSASNKRIEPFEINFIKELKKTVSVVILLTKKDLVSEMDLNAIKTQVKNELGTSIQVIPVCSVEKITRRGSSIPSGKDDVLKASFLGLWSKLSRVLPSRIWDFFNEIEMILEVDLYSEESSDEYNEDDTYFSLSFEKLVDLPSLSDLQLIDLNERDLCNLKIILKGITDLVTYFDDNIQYRSNEYWNSCQNLQNQIFEFYIKVNKEKPQKLYNHKSEDSIQKIILDFEESIDMVYKHINYVTDEIAKISDSTIDWIFSSDNRDETRAAYRELTYCLSAFCSEIINNLSDFEKVYEAELYQFGQCCIRNDDYEL